MGKNGIEISIIIATFNSQKTLPKVLDAIKKQTFPTIKLEILLLDGGSTDKTHAIAKEYHCKIINNPRTEPVYAKFLGYLHANGQYLLYVDDDEVLESPKSIKLKHSVFLKNPQVKAVIGCGYKNPKGYPFINNYINEFGDPFSAFIYNLSKDARYFVSQMKQRYGFIDEKEDCVLFNLHRAVQLPILELCAGGSMFDGQYMKKNFPKTLKEPKLIPHFFYLMNSKKALIAITKNDAIYHYSSDTLSRYLNKIRWRVKNNIYHVSDMGASGFLGREHYSSKMSQFKKYLFIPYSYTILFCLFDACKLVYTRKNIAYLIHVPLCVFTANQIIYHTILKLLGNKPQLKSYGETKVIEQNVPV